MCIRKTLKDIRSSERHYRPFKVCTAVPGSLFSSICVNVLELNEFPRSITVCVRHEILSKFEEWQINYTCISLSTNLPMIAMNASMASTMSTSGMPPMSSASMMAPSTTMTPPASTTSQMMATIAIPMMTSPDGMMITAPNGTGQMGAMGEGGPPEGGNGTPLPMMSQQRKRKKRYTQIKQLLNYWSKIVNDRFRTPLVELDSSIRPSSTDMHKTSVAIPKIPVIAVSSTETVADMKAAILGDMTIDYNENPGTVEPAGLHDRAPYFPSRIPPVVAMTLKQESIINPGRDDILFITDNNSQLRRDNTGNLIFPN